MCIVDDGAASGWAELRYLLTFKTLCLREACSLSYFPLLGSEALRLQPSRGVPPEVLRFGAALVSLRPSCG